MRSNGNVAGPPRAARRRRSASRSSPRATRTTPTRSHVLRHSSAHLLAEAVRRLYPGVKIAIGPPIENGFYYDFEFPEPITEADLERIEAEIGRELDEGREWTREEISRDEARRASRPRASRTRSSSSTPPRATITLYTQGDFTDLCRGPHLQNSKPIKALKLTQPRRRVLARRRDEHAAHADLRHRVLLAGRPRRAPRRGSRRRASATTAGSARSSTSSTSPTTRRARRSGTRRGW